MRIFVILFYVFNLTACLSLSMPNQTKPPTTSGHKVLSISNVGSMSSFIGFVPPGKKDDAEAGSLTPPMPVGVRVGYGITDKIDIESELTVASIPDYYASLGVKYQWLGESAFKIKPNDWTSTAQLKFVYGEGGETREEEFTPLFTKKPTPNDRIITHRYSGDGALYGFSLSNSFGYMVWDWISVYGGGEVIYLSANYEVEVQDYTEPNNTKQEKKKIDDDLWIYGPFAGIQLHTTGPHWKIILALEGSLVNLPRSTGWHKGEKRDWQLPLAASLNILLPF